MANRLKPYKTVRDRSFSLGQKSDKSAQNTKINSLNINLIFFGFK
jgi:hypothetical protein